MNGNEVIALSEKERLVVIGNGMAGARFLEELVSRGGRERFAVAVFGDEPYGNYNRILLSGVLAGSHDPGDIFLNPLAWYAENGIALHAGVRATEIDRGRKEVRGASGVVEPYHTLVIATGSSAYVPEIEGLRGADSRPRPGASVFRSLDDTDGMIRQAATARRAVVIGGGLLGLEAARGLLDRGLERVHVVHHTAWLMHRQLDPAAGEVLRRAMEAIGACVHLETATTRVLGEDRVSGVAFADGAELECDMVVVAAGIRPNVALAAQAGLHVERGIVVHDDLSTHNDPAVYALGECIQHRGVTYGLVAPLWEQATVLADRLSGRDPHAVYNGSLVSTKLKVGGIDLATMGEYRPAGAQDEEVVYSEPARGVYKKLVVRDGRLVGGIVLGDGAITPRLLRLFDRREALPENRAETLFTLAAESATAADLPDDAQVCNCNGVSKGQIVAAAKTGCRTLKAVCDATRAGTGCGSCKGDVQALLELAADGRLAEDPSAHYYVPGVPLTKPELIEAVRERGLRSVSAVFAALADGREDPASKAGLASLLRSVWGAEYEDERDARFINDRVHGNIQRDGTFSVIPRIMGGVTTAEQLRQIADVADKYVVPMIKLTGGQRIDLLGIPKEQLPAVWKDLGMSSGHAYGKSFRTCKTCVGTDFCRYGLGDSTTLGIRIEDRYKGIESPHKMKLAVAGCPRNCSEAMVKDLGAVAIEGGRWEIYIGGAAGANVRKGDVLCTVDSHDEVLLYMGRFMQYYRENARYLERTYHFVERLGIEAIRAVVVDDREGIGARLDAAIQASVDAYVDPWLEAEAPANPTQFADVLEPVGPPAGAALPAR
jgi:nitrite reductase (NADH) large subunit